MPTRPPPADLEERVGLVLRATTRLQNDLDDYSQSVSTSVEAGGARPTYTRAPRDEDDDTDGTLTTVLQNLDRSLRLEAVSNTCMHAVRAFG